MRNLYLIIVVLLSSCQSEINITKAENEAFEEIAQEYQNTYMKGGEHCEAILAAMDESIQFSENGKSWSFSDLEKFCPHLPSKNVINTINNQKLLSRDIGYDFVSQLYINKKGDTLRESASRIWKKSNQSWKIVQMNNLLNKAGN